MLKIIIYNLLVSFVIDLIIYKKKAWKFTVAAILQ